MRLLPKLVCGQPSRTAASAIFVICLAEKVLPQVLFLCLPPHHRGEALLRGVPIRLRGASETAPVRGALALLLRSLSAADEALNYATLATEPAYRYTVLFTRHAW